MAAGRGGKQPPKDETGVEMNTSDIPEDGIDILDELIGGQNEDSRKPRSSERIKARSQTAGPSMARKAIPTTPAMKTPARSSPAVAESATSTDNRKKRLNRQPRTGPFAGWGRRTDPNMTDLVLWNSKDNIEKDTGRRLIDRDITFVQSKMGVDVTQVVEEGEQGYFDDHIVSARLGCQILHQLAGMKKQDRVRIIPQLLRDKGTAIYSGMQQIGCPAKVRLLKAFYYWNYYGHVLSGYEGARAKPPVPLMCVDKNLHSQEWSITEYAEQQTFDYEISDYRAAVRQTHDYARDALYEIYDQDNVVSQLAPYETFSNDEVENAQRELARAIFLKNYSGIAADHPVALAKQEQLKQQQIENEAARVKLRNQTKNAPPKPPARTQTGADAGKMGSFSGFGPRSTISGGTGSARDRRGDQMPRAPSATIGSGFALPIKRSNPTSDSPLVNPKKAKPDPQQETKEMNLLVKQAREIRDLEVKVTVMEQQHQARIDDIDGQLAKKDEHITALSNRVGLQRSAIQSRNTIIHDVLKLNRSMLPMVMDIMSLINYTPEAEEIRRQVTDTISSITQVYGNQALYLLPQSQNGKMIPAEDNPTTSALCAVRTANPEKMTILDPVMNIKSCLIIAPPNTDKVDIEEADKEDRVERAIESLEDEFDIDAPLPELDTVGDAGKDEAGNDEAGKDEAGNDEAGNDEAGKDEAGKDEAGNDEGIPGPIDKPPMPKASLFKRPTWGMPAEPAEQQSQEERRRAAANAEYEAELYSKG